ncbi:MAG: sigma-70 family RNA polymerase sigma factor [Chitinophagaceae bacterium]
MLQSTDIDYMVACTPDKELAMRIQNGDSNAFNTIYWKYQEALHANIFKLTRNFTVTEDIIQEVFVRLWEKRSTLDPEKSVAGWLFTVSFNLSVNYLKKKLKESLAYSEFQKDIIIEDTSEEMAGIELGTLKKAINQLSPQKRKVFELCKIKGKTYEEASRELKISKHTVKEYLSGAIYCIKDYLQQHSPEHITLALVMTLSIV